jgi:hypothetical protein
MADRIEELEYDLARHPDNTPVDVLGRRLILRGALTAWGRKRYDEGLHEGMRDVRDSHHRAEELQYAADRRAVESGVVTVSRADLLAILDGTPGEIRDRFREALGASPDD